MPLEDEFIWQYLKENDLYDKRNKSSKIYKKKDISIFFNVTLEDLQNYVKFSKIEDNVVGELYYLYNNDVNSLGYDNMYNKHKELIENINTWKEDI